MCRKEIDSANLSAKSHFIAKIGDLRDYIRSIKTLNCRVYDAKCRSNIIVNLLIPTTIYLIIVCIKDYRTLVFTGQNKSIKKKILLQWLPMIKRLQRMENFSFDVNFF